MSRRSQVLHAAFRLPAPPGSGRFRQAGQAPEPTQRPTPSRRSGRFRQAGQAPEPTQRPPVPRRIGRLGQARQAPEPTQPRTTTTDPLARTTTVAYDALDRAAAVIAPLVGATTRRTTFTYNAEGQVATVADPLNRVTTTTYNSRGWAATLADPAGNTTTYGYSATGQVDSWFDQATSGGSGTAYTYDEIDRLVAVRDPLNHTTTTVYDAVGNLTARVDGNGNRTTFAYDARDRMTTLTDPLLHATVLGYDNASNRTTVTDPLAHVTTTAFDALNRVTTVTDARGGVTAFGFDGAGRRTTVVDPVGNRTTTAYDLADRATTLTDALGTATTAYDAADQVTGRTDRIGRQVTFAYDSGGRAINERWLNLGGSIARTTTFTFDAANQLTGVSDPDATLTFTYDSGGRPITARTAGTATGQPDLTLTAGFDAAGRRVNLTDNLASIGRTTFAYDPASRLTQADRTYGGAAGPRVDYAYDAANRLTTLTRTVGGGGTQVRSLYAYDAANRLTTLVHDKLVGGTATPLASFVYGYDDANRLATEANAEGLATFAYDNTNQLTGADRPGTSLDESYGYDLAGNRNTTGYATTTGNRLTASPGATYSYDAEGHTTARTDTATGKVTTFAYDHRDRLVGATTKTSGGAVTMQATYTYDALGRRIATEVDADGAGAGPAVKTWTVFDGEDPYADFNGSGTLQQRYLYGPAIDALLARTDSGGTTAWYLPDRLGSVRDVVSTAGTVIYHAAYASFGALTSSTGTGGDRFGFTGRELNPETGDYYVRARHYGTAAGRFTSRDPIGFAGGDANTYRYVGNGPTDATDPTGLYPDDPQGPRPPRPEITGSQDLPDGGSIDITLSPEGGGQERGGSPSTENPQRPGGPGTGFNDPHVPSRPERDPDAIRRAYEHPLEYLLGIREQARRDAQGIQPHYLEAMRAVRVYRDRLLREQAIQQREYWAQRRSLQMFQKKYEADLLSFSMEDMSKYLAQMAEIRHARDEAYLMYFEYQDHIDEANHALGSQSGTGPR